MNLIAWIQAQAWKLAFGAATVGLLVTGVLLLDAKGDVKRAEAATAVLSDEIHRPGTGWSARLNQCQTNNANLQGQLEAQNQSIRLANAKSDARMAEATAALAEARKMEQSSQNRIATIMQKLVAADTCSRVFELDQRFLETLK